MQPSQDLPGASPPAPPDLHDVRHLRGSWRCCCSVGAGVFVACTLRDLASIVVAGWPLGYWIAAQGGVVVFIGIVVAYGWAMNRLERPGRAGRGTAAAIGGPWAKPPSAPGAAVPHGACTASWPYVLGCCASWH